MNNFQNLVYGSFILTTVLTSCEKDIYNTKAIDCSQAEIGNNHPKANEYQMIIDQYVAIGFPGISAYIKDGSGVWVGSSGFADISQGIKFEPCHISKAASITKCMVGALTMKLQEEGVLDIDDPVSKYIGSDILDKINHPNGMTLRNLMTHTTGIADLIKTSAFYLDVLNYPNRTWEPEELLKYIYGAEPVELTDEYPAKYSNTNTLLLSMCINTATGRPHYELLREKILDPLGMTDTYYQSREKLPETTAQGYFDLHNSGELLNVSNFITGSGNGYGGIFSNVFDLNKFLTALLIDKTLLSSSSLDDMLSDFYPSGKDEYIGGTKTAAGFLKKFGGMKYQGIGHSGKDLGYSADMFYFSDVDMSMIFFINYGTDGASQLRDSFYAFERDIMLKMFED